MLYQSLYHSPGAARCDLWDLRWPCPQSHYGIRKSTVIATCLVNSNMISGLEDAEAAVRNIFLTEFPHRSLNEWNNEIGDRQA